MFEFQAEVPLKLIMEQEGVRSYECTSDQPVRVSVMFSVRKRVLQPVTQETKAEHDPDPDTKDAMKQLNFQGCMAAISLLLSITKKKKQ